MQNLKFGIASVLLLGIAVVILLPALDLQPTTVRTLRPAVTFAVALHVAALGLWDRSISSQLQLPLFLRAVPIGTGSLVDLNCIRLC
jgi:hypothetical protein